MLLGQHIPAGPGWASVLPSIDFETYSEAGFGWNDERARWVALQHGKPGLPAVGAWVYAEHPTAEILCCAYDLKEGRGRRLWKPGDPNPLDLLAHIRNGGPLEAWNSFFEYAIFYNVAGSRLGWPVPDISQMYDAMAKARAWTLPGKLEQSANVLAIEDRKDTDGHKVMLKVSKPRSPSKKDARLRYTPADAPAEFAALYAYCKGDIAAEDGVSIRCADLSEREREYFLCDQAINARGVACDRPTVEASLDIIRQAEARYFAEVAILTGGAVQTTNELEKMKAWLKEQGTYAPEITKDTIDELIESAATPAARRVLEIRRAMGSAAVKKCKAMSLQMCADDRVRGLYTYAGASRTRRWTGGGLQPQNMTSGGPSVVRCGSCRDVYWAGLPACPACFDTRSAPAEWGIEAVESCVRAIHTRSLAVVESLWGDALAAIAGCLRGMLIAGPGCEFLSSDLTAIEAVVLSELAGETWRQEVFRTHGRIYEMCASKISGVPFEEFERYRDANDGAHHPYRKKLGKIPELASGYQGWVSAWIDFGAGAYMNEEEIKDNIMSWRRASPMIVRFWKEIGAAAVMAVEQPGTCFGYRSIRFQVLDDVLYCQLPSGRSIPYHTPRVRDGLRYGKPHKFLTYWGQDSKTKQWVEIETHGGKLTGHITQGTARDIFAAGLARVERAGYRVVLHTHDELTVEVPTGGGSIEHVEALMTEREPWFADWPVKADGGWRGLRYRKG